MSTIIKDLGAVSAYAYAVEKGYTGTEAEFAEAMANIVDISAEAETLEPDDEATASYSGGVLSFGIPKGDKGDTGETGATGATGATGNGIASIAKTGTSGLVDTYTITFTDGTTTTFDVTNGTAAIDATLSIAGRAADAKATGDAVDDLKSKVSALPTDGVVANSKQLLSKNGTDNTEPYMFRAVPVNADRAELDAVVGGTVAWNQLIQNGNFTTTNNWAPIYGTIAASNNECIYTISTIDGTLANRIQQTIGTLLKGHKYFATAGIYLLYANNVRIRAGSQIKDFSANVITANKWNDLHTIFNPSSDDSSGYFFVTFNTNVGYSVGGQVKIRNVILVDLTTLFGSTIADYIYQLEQSTAGAGVAFFRKLFPKDYYPYDTGTLKSVEGVSSHDMVGFNQWDEEWELGRYDVNGVKISSSNSIRCKNRIDVLPSTYYYFNFPDTATMNNIVFLDADGNKVGSTYAQSNRRLILTPEATRYMVFQMSDTCGITYNHDICVNLSDPVKNGTYEPYIKHTYPLDNTLTLRGVPKLADGKLSYDGDRYLPDGTVERRYGIRAYQSGDESLADAITDGTNTVYKLTTPTTETADPYQSLQVCDPNGTEEFVTTGIVPVGHETRYPENLRAKIEGLPWDFSSLIAPTEKTTTASRNYTTGSLLIMGNVLYKVTANIANGGTITPGTNVTATTLSEVISALQ